MSSKLLEPPMLNWSKLLPTNAQPDCFSKPMKIEVKKVAQEMTETWIVRPCLFPAAIYPYILFSRDKLLMKYYIPSNPRWLLMRHFRISSDSHDFPQDHTMMLKNFFGDDLRSTTQDREKIDLLQW
ncbi:hypothetical protein BHE74_00041070 [Ensete ventricosum]|nr:hypothetical protein BHE74_00041070 [Ensete ventricosum]